MMTVQQLLASVIVLTVLGLCEIADRTGKKAVAREQQRWRTAPRVRRVTAEDADEHLFVG